AGISIITKSRCSKPQRSPKSFYTQPSVNSVIAVAKLQVATVWGRFSSLALLTINILTFGFALWLGLYLLARNPAKALLRYAGLGILAYALSLAAEILSENAPSITITAALLLMQQFLVLLPA